MNVGQGMVGVILLTYYHERCVCEVPVIVLWTRTESLDDDMITELMNKGNSFSEAEQQASQKAWVKYEQEIYEYFVRLCNLSLISVGHWCGIAESSWVDPRWVDIGDQEDP